MSRSSALPPGGAAPRRVLLTAVVLVLAGCQGGPEDQADDMVSVALEGDAVTEALDAEGRTPWMTAEEPFVRLGVLWEHDEPTPPDVRMRSDVGAAWSEWTPVEVVFAEAGSHAGHVDAAGPMTQYQVRFPAGSPTSLAFDTIGYVPDLSGEPSVDDYDPEEVEGDGGDTTYAEEAGDVGASSVGLRMGRFRVRSRAAWGARRPRCRDRGPTPTRVTFHHTVTPTHDSVSPERRLRLIQAYHMDSRGWCDIGYNYLISRDGRVWRGRGANYIGAHVSNNNSGNVGIAFMGTHTRHRATRKQRRQAARMVVRLRRRGFPISLSRADIDGHRDFGGTSCPGDALYGQIGQIIRIARNTL